MAPETPELVSNDGGSTPGLPHGEVLLTGSPRTAPGQAGEALLRPRPGGGHRFPPGCVFQEMISKHSGQGEETRGRPSLEGWLLRERNSEFRKAPHLLGAQSVVSGGYSSVFLFISVFFFLERGLTLSCASSVDANLPLPVSVWLPLLPTLPDYRRQSL